MKTVLKLYEIFKSYCIVGLKPLLFKPAGTPLPRAPQPAFPM